MVPPLSIHRPFGPAVLIRFAAFAIIAFGAAAPAFSAEIMEKHTLKNSKVKIVIVKARRSPSDSNGIIGVKKITDLATATDFSAIFSPVFSVELRNLYDPTDFPPLMIPPGPVDPLFMPIDDIAISDDSADQVSLYWSGIPVAGTDQFLYVLAQIKLRPDLKAQWDIWASITDSASGPTASYGVYAVRFPYMALDVIQRDGSTDRLVSPLTGGMKLREPVLNPNDFPERDSVEGSQLDALFTYPGHMFTQWMAYYDPNWAGLYMAAEDPNGYTKNLYFSSANSRLRPSIRRFYWYLTHFNTAPPVASGLSLADRQADWQMFSQSGKLGYYTVTDTFIGDWIDASQIYRNWAVGSSVPFLSDGPLVSRSDFSPDVKLETKAFRYQLPIDVAAIDPAAEYDKVQQTLRFWDDVEARFVSDSVRNRTALMLSARTNLNVRTGEPDEPEMDDVAGPIRPGVPEWLDAIQHPMQSDYKVGRVALNRDTTGIETDGQTTAQAYVEAVMRNSQLAPMIPKTGAYRTCVGSPWLWHHRSDLVMQMIADSTLPAAMDPGFTVAALSGTGNFSFACFAPAVDDPAEVDSLVHAHPVGGGNYLAEGWHRLADELRTRAESLYAIPLMLLGMEHEPETQISDFILNGRSFTDPYDDSAPEVGHTTSFSTPVPLFKFLYHDYNVWPGKVPPFTEAVQLYVDGSHPLSDLILLRYRIAQLAMLGRLLIVQISQEPDFVTYENIPSALPFELQDEHQLFAAMAALRDAFRPYLIYGQAARDPGITPMDAADSVSFTTIWKGVPSVNTVPRVVASAWMDPYITGNPAVFLTNFTPQGATVTFSVKPADLGLDPGFDYHLIRLTAKGVSSDTGMQMNGSDAMFVSDPIYVPPLEDALDEPWRVYILLPY